MSQVPPLPPSPQPSPSPYPQAHASNIIVSGQAQAQTVPQDYYPEGYVQQPVGGYMPPRTHTLDGIEMARVTPQILLLMILSGIQRNWKWALPCGLILGAIAFGALWFLFPIKYEATAWIQMRTNKPVIIRTQTDNVDYENFVQTQFTLISSPIILKKALENPKIAQLSCITREKDRVAWLRRNVVLKRFAKSEFSTISIETELPEDAANIVNSILDAYISYYLVNSSKWNTDLVNQLNNEINRQNSSARFLEKEIREKMESAAKNNAVVAGAGSTESSGLFAPGESLKRDIYLHESNLASLQAELKMLQEMVGDPNKRVPQSMLEIAINNDPSIILLNRRKASIEDRLAKYKEKVPRDDDPQVVRMNDQIKAIDNDITRVKLTLAATKEYEMGMTLKAQADSDIYETQKAIKREEILVQTLNAKYEQQLNAIQDRTTKITDVTFQQQQLKRINNVLDILNERLIAVKAENNGLSQIDLQERATVPIQPKTQKRIFFAAFGGVAFLLFPTFLGIVLERSKPKLYHVSQIRRACPDIIIGEIMEPPVAWIQGSNFRKRLARYRESVHSWCTHLLLSDPFRSCRTIAIASVSSDDGKTFLAVQVAVAMAQMRTGRVLLIDGDMRVGRLHLLFGNEEAGIGLADVLSMRNRVGEAIVMDAKDSNLHFLSAGNLDVSPYELLGDGNFKDLLDFLERDFSLILVVVPPVTHAAESLLMASSTDSVLLCVRQGETVLAAMEDVFRKLVSTGSNVDGIVVKDIPYYQMAGKDGGFADKLEQIRLSHLLQYAD
ncbi:MAG: hypothetical protein LBQ66_01920 [Planctomycetaceae bacterium]|jgi:capsular exopolysaccharide synthesis family protein|nr:hypothetical protein [Planctomycetaceae bacterium]